jgi:hypothetical protein
MTIVGLHAVSRAGAVKLGVEPYGIAHSGGDCPMFALNTGLPKYRDQAHPLTPDQNPLSYS